MGLVLEFETFDLILHNLQVDDLVLSNDDATQPLAIDRIIARGIQIVVTTYHDVVAARDLILMPG